MCAYVWVSESVCVCVRVRCVHVSECGRARVFVCVCVCALVVQLPSCVGGWVGVSGKSGHEDRVVGRVQRRVEPVGGKE